MSNSKSNQSSVSKIEITSKEWQDQSGNTYYSAQMVINDNETIYLSERYGYGSQYLYSCLEILAEIMKMDSMSVYMLENMLNVEVIDNGAKSTSRREMRAFGRA